MAIPNCKDCKHLHPRNECQGLAYSFGGDCKLTLQTVSGIEFWRIAASERMAGDCGPEGKYFEHKEGSNE